MTHDYPMRRGWVFAFTTIGLLAAIAVFAGYSGSNAVAATQASTAPGTPAAPPTAQATPPSSSAVPVLHKIVHVTLSPSYGCQPAHAGALRYEKTALFLSDSSRNLNAPELLFNGACGSPDFFDVQMAGDDLSLITDYGAVALTEWATQNAFSSTPERRGDKLASFVMTSPVRLGHTYGVVINKSNGVRGLLYFTVTDYVPNQKVGLDYAVMDYQILSVRTESPGFDWKAKPN